MAKEIEGVREAKTQPAKKPRPKSSKPKTSPVFTPDLLNKVVVKAWSGYIPVKPTPLQLGFCILPSRTVLYGGAAGGGKSEALLMAALQYADVPGYSAIIFRKSYMDLAKKGALLDRALTWLGPHLGKTVTFDWSTKTFKFQSGATLSFGYMGTKNSGDAIQGAEYHFVGVDEVTQHFEQDVAWAESRLRRTMDTRIPLRVRFTGNPGNRGNEWVKRRFGIKRNPLYNLKEGEEVGGHFFSKQPMFVGTDKENVFIPARLIDNPYLDCVEYVRSFKHMDDLTKAQLLDGDWDSSPVSRFRKHWFPRYGRRGEYYTYGATEITTGGMRRLATVDVAASVREGAGAEQFYTRGGSRGAAIPCWTVISTWGLSDNHLYLLDVDRGQMEAPDVFSMIDRNCKKWRAHEVYVEGNGVGRPVAQVAATMGLPVSEVWTYHDKIQNAYVATAMAKDGKIILPEEGDDAPSWLTPFQDEVFTWTGHPDETSDQVDTVSTAAKVVQDRLLPRQSGGMDAKTRMPTVVPSAINYALR